MRPTKSPHIQVSLHWTWFYWVAHCAVRGRIFIGVSSFVDMPTTYRLHDATAQVASPGAGCCLIECLTAPAARYRQAVRHGWGQEPMRVLDECLKTGVERFIQHRYVLTR